MKSKRSDGEGSIVDWMKGGKKIGKRGAIRVGTKPDGSPDRRYVTGRNSKEVSAKLQALREQSLNGGLPVGDKRANLYDLYEKVVGYKEAQALAGQASLNTVADYRSHMKTYVLPRFGNTKLAAFNEYDVQQHFLSLLAPKESGGRGLSRQTAKNAFAKLRACLNQGVKWGMLPAQNANIGDAPTVPVHAARALAAEESEALMDAIAGHPLEPLWLTSLTTGLRPAELRGIRWDDIDLGRGSITVARTLNRYEGEWCWGPPKTDKSARVVHLPPFVMEVLKVYKDRWAFKHGTANNTWVQEHKIVFVTPGTSLPFQEANVGRQLKDACIRAGIPVVPLYGLRHSFATYLLAKDIQTKIVSDMMGHTTTKMTERYQHTTPDLQQHAVDAWGTRTAGV